MSALPKSRMCVVTTNFNYGDYLEDCLRSVIYSRGFDRVDYIVMDGGSTDGSLDIVELNPAYDVRNRTAELAVDLAESLFGKSTLMR